MEKIKEIKNSKINIQFFAEGDEGGEGNQGNPPKTYSEEDYQKLKSSFDKTSSELAELKKQMKGKLSEDEKKAQEQEEINQKLRDYESKFEDFELKDELMKANIFTSDEVDKIVAKKESKKELLNSVISLVNQKIEEAKKTAVAEFMRSSDTSGGSGGNGKNTDKDVEAFINGKKKDTSSKARDYYLK